ncbi:WG repeat-containing protein [Dyadobacter psychrotolerans]|uniref:WG repeat-containing protein n=1 Tax=Dyadobacter psychrotolerans TaxID=2541721 RepID=A0A4R5DIP1_9BACT|nr:WG repeat-containing protein [Dyadobacter psychrotolerans]
MVVIVFQLQALLAFKSSAQNPSWLNQYSEHQLYGNVYVVKKIDIPCRTYSSFILDKNGNKLTPAYKDIGDFSDGLAEFVPFETDSQGQGLHGFINKKGKVIVEPVYLGTDKFYKGKTWVIYPAGKQYGLSYIDTTGKTLYRIPIEYFKNDFLIAKAKIAFLCNRDAKEDIIWWKKDELYLLNWNFSPFIEKEIKESSGIYHFLYKGKYGIVDKNLVLKIPVALDDIDPEYKFSGQGMERVKYGGKYGYINVFTGEMVTPFEFTKTRKPTNGLFWVQKNKKWGCIDKTGKVRIPFLYDEANGFTAENRSAVSINGKFGHIDKSGKIRTPLKYDFASYFHNGRSLVRIKDKYGYIDVNDKLVTPIHYDYALPFDDITTTANRHGLRYELTLDGKERFVGFSAGWNGLFILIGVVLIVYINSYFFKRSQKRKITKLK